MRCRSLLCAMMMCLVPAALAAQGTRLTDVRQYLMSPGEEVALARSAAPLGIGDAASVWLLTADGYREVERGSNGFACFVGRGWSGPLMVGAGDDRRVNPDAFDPEVRAPHCFNPKAVASVLPWQVFRTRLLLEGVPAEAVEQRVAEAVAGGTLTTPSPGAMAYMMSPGQDLGPAVGAWRPHLMIYLAGLSNEAWGVPRFTSDYPFVAESGTPWAVAVTPMRFYSDGSEASAKVTGRHH